MNFPYFFPSCLWRTWKALFEDVFDDLRVNFLGNPLNLSFGTAKKHVFFKICSRLDGNDESAQTVLSGMVFQLMDERSYP